MDPIELNSEYVHDMLKVLSGFNVSKFKCSAFEVEFQVPEKQEEKEAVSTDVRGFVAAEPAPAEEAEPADPFHLHRTALRGSKLSLAPKDA